MSESRSVDEVEAEDTTVHVGDILRNAREEKSITITEVASRLNLEEHVVKALEQDNYESLPELAYIRGYLLAYIRLMELPTSTLKLFDEAHQISRPLMSTRHTIESSCSQDGWVKCINTGLVVVLIIVSVLWVLEQSFNVLDISEIVNGPSESINAVDSDNAETVEVSSRETEAGQSEEDASVMEHMPAGQSDAILSLENEVQAELLETAVDDSATLPDSQIVEPEDQPVPQVDQQPVLTMKFFDTTWIRIDDEEGNRLQAGTFNKGDDIHLSHSGPLHLIIGRTNNVELSYEGEVVDLSVFKSGKVARLVLGESVE